ncbi:MAG TPA: UvrD-helicase domain-containing protein, partial [Candidatus Binatia bacterium]|nr:UvrD-helicase domain-containing protein [Candidatus Binatia bacterium]
MTLEATVAPAWLNPVLEGLDPEQRAAAMLTDGPAQIIAPAGSGKTTTLIARMGVLLGRGVAADRIGVVTFNREAAAELSARIASRLAPHVPGAEAIEVRTLHAMARQVCSIPGARSACCPTASHCCAPRAGGRSPSFPRWLRPRIPHPSLPIRRR